jgi:hypothetical protein
MFHLLPFDLVVRSLLFLLDGNLNVTWLSGLTVNKAWYATFKSKNFYRHLSFHFKVPEYDASVDTETDHDVQKFKNLLKALFSLTEVLRRRL